MKKISSILSIILALSIVAHAEEQKIESEAISKFYCGFSYGGATLPTATLGMRYIKDTFMFDGHIGYRYFETDSNLGNIHVPHLSLGVHALFNSDATGEIYAGMGTKVEYMVYGSSKVKNNYLFYPQATIGKTIPINDHKECFVEMCYIPYIIGKNCTILTHTFETHLGFNF